MVEMGARFYKNLYVKTSFNTDDGTCVVTVVSINGEGTEVVKTGAVTWDD